ncbi:MAG: PaaI family thioesterase [Actinomycetaceae bacterium]|nr:PaaI family thioesterase [Arcanobacterium sp.]MDD7686662.1 PaaI family thioesterase [Actinomycetaceae bacterium]MDY5273831.1 PaaI family thioesterase [Arcanobacterium sp.]
MSILDDAGLELIEASSQLVVYRYTVNAQLTQIHGVLHGGISAAIAEQAASLGATQTAAEGFIAVGTGLETHHLRPVSLGMQCEARAVPENAGRLQVWRVEQRILTTGELFNVSSVSVYLKRAR